MKTIKRRTFLTSSVAFASAVGFDSRSFGQSTKDTSGAKKSHIVPTISPYQRIPSGVSEMALSCLSKTT